MIEFLGKTYRLGLFNAENDRPMWAFVPEGQTLQNWTTQLTIVSRPDALVVAEMNTLSEGMAAYYQSVGGQVLSAQTIKGDDGREFNYLVVGIDQPASRRFELNFVRILMGPAHVITVIFGIRITDPLDYLTKTKSYLDLRSSAVGHALGTFVVPPLESLPREIRPTS